MIENEVAPDEDWQRYPVQVITKAKSYEQGMRRLERAYQTIDVESSEAEKQLGPGDQFLLMDPKSVAEALNQRTPLNPRKNTDSGFNSESLECVEVITARKSQLDDSQVKNKNKKRANEDDRNPPAKKLKSNLMNFNDLGQYLQSIIEKESEKTRRSLSLAITKRYRKELADARFSATNPNNNQAWKTIGEDLPFTELDKFLEFDVSLKTDEEKKTHWEGSILPKDYMQISIMT